jgi:hypothetical protein
MVHFRGTFAETSICPRRHAINNPWVFTAHEFFGHTNGKLGMDFLGISSKMVDAIAVVDDAVDWRRESSDGNG